MADYSTPPKSIYLIADFFQLFFVWLQCSVFRHERFNTNLVQLAGSNHEIIYDEEPYKNNPYHDFVTKFHSYLDNLKFIVYMYSYWFVLALVFYTGTNRISVLGMGYVILCFFFLWYGQNFLSKPIQKLVRMWNIIIFYCFLVILIKVCMQILFCILYFHINNEVVCIMVDLIGINCRLLESIKVNKCQDFNKIAINMKLNYDSTESDTGLFWDAVSFSILIFQKRLYMSRMFQHVVNELKIQSILAASGAKIFNKLISEKIQIDLKREETVLGKIKRNLERIRQRQQATVSKKPNEHYELIRSGDYYMFEDELNSTEVVVAADKEDAVDSSRAQVSGLDHVDLNLKSSKNETEDEVTSEKLKKIRYIKRHIIIAIERLIQFLNKYSHDFRQVSKKLTKEKIMLRSMDFNSTLQADQITNVDDVDAEYDLHGKPLLYRLFNSIYYLILSQSELVCYFLMILTHLLSASILSLLLPLSIFLWALLSLPRPNKTYWITCITYIEVSKCAFNANNNSNSDFNI